MQNNFLSPLLLLPLIILHCNPLYALTSAPSQDQIDRLRVAARQKLQDLQYYDFVADFVNINLYPDIGSSVYDISDYGDSSINILKIPFSHEFDSEMKWTPFVEFNLGLFRSNSYIADLQNRFEFDAILEDSEVTSDWKGISLLIGGGASTQISDHWSFKPSVDFAWSYFENESEFSGPGRDVFFKILNGLATDWEVNTYTYIASLQADYEREVAGMTIQLIEKFSYLYTQFDHHDEILNDFNSKDTIWASRIDVEDSFEVHLWGWELGWSLFAGHYRFDLSDSELMGLIKYYNEVGGYLITAPGKKILGVSRVRLGTSYIFGNNISGYSIGLGFDF